MPVPTMFHSRTSKLCTSMGWKDWAGYHAVCSYAPCHDPEIPWMTDQSLAPPACPAQCLGSMRS